MNDTRQKIRSTPASLTGPKGEALTLNQRGSESSTARGDPESLAGSEQLMEQACERENLKRALARVRRNKGSAGVDAMGVEELPTFLKAHWPTLRAQWLAGQYQPQAIKRVAIPKPGGGNRHLGIPTVLDRFIQQALWRVLQPLFEPTFSESSYGFRPARSAHQAVRRAQTLIAQGHPWVVDIDLAQFFDRVNHDLLMSRVAKKVADNADDANIYVKSERAGRRVKVSITRFLEKRLKLKVNEAKSAVAQVWQRKFLGFSFTHGENPRRRIAPQAIARFKQRVRPCYARSINGFAGGCEAWGGSTGSAAVDVTTNCAGAA